MALGYSAKLPLTTQTSHYDLINDVLTNVRQNLKNILLTCPGERVMLPDFGVGVRKYLFENDANFIAAEIESLIYEQVQAYMGFLQIRSIQFLTSLNSESIKENEMALQILYTIPALSLHDSLLITP
jgi:phage baseplate assembly protein W